MAASSSTRTGLVNNENSADDGKNRFTFDAIVLEDILDDTCIVGALVLIADQRIVPFPST